MTPSIENKIRITTAAVEWLHRLEADPGQDIEDQFAAWLRQSPHHLPEFLKQEKIEAAMRRMRAERVAAPQEIPASAIASPRWKPRALAASLLILAGLPLIGLGAWHSTPTESHSTEATALDVSFSGGSHAKLYPGTRLTSRSLAGYSQITVDRGGARFHVRHRLWQRFEVQAGAARVTATGTAFNLLRTKSRVDVYVAEGGVRLESHSQQTMLLAGQSGSVSDDGVIGNIQSPPATASTTSRHLNNVSLAIVVDEVNRRNQTPHIVVEGPARQKRFRLAIGFDDPDAWLAALATYPDLKIERRGDHVTIRSVTADQK